MPTAPHKGSTIQHHLLRQLRSLPPEHRYRSPQLPTMSRLFRNDHSVVWCTDRWQSLTLSSGRDVQGEAGVSAQMLGVLRVGRDAQGMVGPRVIGKLRHMLDLENVPGGEQAVQDRLGQRVMNVDEVVLERQALHRDAQARNRPLL